MSGSTLVLVFDEPLPMLSCQCESTEGAVGDRRRDAAWCRSGAARHDGIRGRTADGVVRSIAATAIRDNERDHLHKSNGVVTGNAR